MDETADEKLETESVFPFGADFGEDFFSTETTDKRKNSRQQRRREKQQHFHQNSDDLEDELAVGPKEFVAEQRKDSSLQPLWEVTENDRREEDRVENDNNEQIKVENGLLYHDRTGNGEPVKQLVVPQSYRMKLLSLVHGSPLAAHLGR